MQCVLLLLYETDLRVSADSFKMVLASYSGCFLPSLSLFSVNCVLKMFGVFTEREREFTARSPRATGTGGERAGLVRIAPIII